VGVRWILQTLLLTTGCRNWEAVQDFPSLDYFAESLDWNASANYTRSASKRLGQSQPHSCAAILPSARVSCLIFSRIAAPHTITATPTAYYCVGCTHTNSSTYADPPSPARRQLRGHE
jgi:hypothetical protein